MSRKPKLLLITYYWPPAGGPGVQRWLKLAVLLRDRGYEVCVLTPQEPVAANYDASLTSEIPADLQVIKTKARDPFKWYQLLRGKKGAISTGGIGLSGPRSPLQKAVQYLRANFFIPDARKGWNYYALPAARILLVQDAFKAIITTGPPHSTHLMGLALQREFGLPWLADFRDPWVNIFYNRFFPRTASTQARDQALENKVLAQADCILTVSPGLASEFADRARRIELLYNGYDPADIPAPAREEEPEIFSLSYIGNFKPNQNLKALWSVLAALCATNPAFARALRLRFVGNVDPGVQADISAAGLDHRTEYLGYQPHAAATRAMVQSSVLLFIVPQTQDNDLILTGKLFEYLGSARPLLAVGPPKGNAAAIIAETGRGTCLNYEDEAAMQQRLLALFRQWQQKPASLRLDAAPTLPYTRAGAADRLAQILNSLDS